MPAIRVATENDIPRILELYHQLAQDEKLAELTHINNIDKYRQVFNQIEAFPGQQLLVAEEQGEVVGTMVLLIVPNLAHDASPWAEIENMVVAEQYRSQGLGQQLFEYALAQAKEAGCYKIQLCSNNSRERAHKFYRSMGFKASAKGFRLYLK